MRVLNIAGIILSVALWPLTYYYVDKTNYAHWVNSPLLPYSIEETVAEVTTEACSVMIFIGVLLIVQNIINLLKVRTNTVKSLTIVAISLLGLGIMHAGLMLSRPSHITFDEGGQVWLIAGMMMLAFSIVYLAQFNRLNQSLQGNDEILDDIT